MMKGELSPTNGDTGTHRYIKGILMKIACGTVAIESPRPAPAVCTPALHSLSAEDRLVLDTETDESI
jgi:hypothetical protein